MPDEGKRCGDGGVHDECERAQGHEDGHEHRVAEGLAGVAAVGHGHLGVVAGEGVVAVAVVVVVVQHCHVGRVGHNMRCNHSIFPLSFRLGG